MVDAAPWTAGEPTDRMREYEIRRIDGLGGRFYIRADGVAGWCAFSAKTIAVIDINEWPGWPLGWKHRPLPEGCSWWQDDDGSGWVYHKPVETTPPDDGPEPLFYIQSGGYVGASTGNLCIPAKAIITLAEERFSQGAECLTILPRRRRVAGLERLRGMFEARGARAALDDAWPSLRVEWRSPPAPQSAMAKTDAALLDFLKTSSRADSRATMVDRVLVASVDDFVAITGNHRHKKEAREGVARMLLVIHLADGDVAVVPEASPDSTGARRAAVADAFDVLSDLDMTETAARLRRAFGHWGVGETEDAAALAEAADAARGLAARLENLTPGPDVATGPMGAPANGTRWLAAGVGGPIVGMATVRIRARSGTGLAQCRADGWHVDLGSGFHHSPEGWRGEWMWSPLDRVPDGWVPTSGGGYVRKDGAELWQMASGPWYCVTPDGAPTADRATPDEAVADLDAPCEMSTTAGWIFRLTAPDGRFADFTNWTAKHVEGMPGEVELRWADNVFELELEAGDTDAQLRAAVIADGKLIGRFQARDLIAEAFGVKPEGTLAEVVASLAPKADAPARWRDGEILTSALARYSLLVGDPARSPGEDAERGRLKERLNQSGTSPGWVAVSIDPDIQRDDGMMPPVPHPWGQAVAVEPDREIRTLGHGLSLPEGWEAAEDRYGGYTRTEDDARLLRRPASAPPRRRDGWWYCYLDGRETPCFADPLDAIAELDGLGSDDPKPHFVPLPEIEGWERMPGGVPTYKRTSDGVLMIQKTDVPINRSSGTVGLWCATSGAKGRLTLDRKTTAEVIADLADFEPAAEPEPAHQHEGTCEPTRCEFHDPTCPVAVRVEGWGIPARWYGERGVRSGLLERDGDEWVFSTVPDARDAGASTPMAEVLRLRCSGTADDIVVRDFPDASEHDNARILIDPDGKLAVVDRYGDWVKQHREDSPADPALAGWREDDSPGLVSWALEVHRRGDLAVLHSPSTGRADWGAGLYSEKPEDSDDPWPLRFLFHDSKEDAMRAAHEGEKAHPWGPSSAHPGWSDEPRTDEPPRDGAYQVQYGTSRGVAMWTGSGWAALWMDFDDCPGYTPPDEWPVGDDKWTWIPLVPSVATVERAEEAEEGWQTTQPPREVCRWRNTAPCGGGPMPEGTARPNAVHGWSLLWDGGGQECSFSYLPDGWQWLPEAAQQRALARFQSWARRAIREGRSGAMVAGATVLKMNDEALRDVLAERMDRRDLQAKHLGRWHAIARAHSGLPTEASDDELRTALLDDLRPPSGELLARVEARLLALLPEEIAPLTDSAASLVRLYFEMHASLSGGGR